MDGSIIIVLLLISYMIYKSLYYGDPLKTDPYSKVPKQYYKAYKEYLKTEEWRHLREYRQFVDDYRCTRCGSITNLQCHHTNYSGIEDMSFFLSQLETVCSSCHSKIHAKRLPMSK